jgi:hypothetical protein
VAGQVLETGDDEFAVGRCVDADRLLRVGHQEQQFGAFLGPEQAGVDGVEPLTLQAGDHRREIHAQEHRIEAHMPGHGAGELDVEALQVAFAVDELLRRQGRVDRHLPFAGFQQVIGGDFGRTGLRLGDAAQQEDAGEAEQQATCQHWGGSMCEWSF